jgi:recombination protein RecR
MQDPLEKLTNLFLQFPGIGKRQARRFVHHLLTQGPEKTKVLADTLQTIHQHTIQCTMCYKYTTEHTNRLCMLCNLVKNPEQLMIVEKDVDIDSFARSSIYKGYYFVFGGLVPILDAKYAERVRFEELKKRILSQSDTLKEIIFAFSINNEGEHTAHIIKEKMQSYIPKHITLTTLGRGLSTGSEMEYADPDTLAHALDSRNPIQ